MKLNLAPFLPRRRAGASVALPLVLADAFDKEPVEDQDGAVEDAKGWDEPVEGPDGAAAPAAEALDEPVDLAREVGRRARVVEDDVGVDQLRGKRPLGAETGPGFGLGERVALLETLKLESFRAGDRKPSEMTLAGETLGAHQ